MSELYNLEAESLTLAAMLRYPEDYWSINDVGLSPADFSGTENRRVMKAIAAVVAEKKVPDMVAVLEEVRMSGEDTAAYVMKLNDIPCSVPQAHEYARTVKSLSVARQLGNAGAKIIEVARERRTDYETAIANAESLLSAVKRVLPPDERSGEPADILNRIRSSGPTDVTQIRFSPTLQRVSGGMAPGHFWVIGGFSSVGKSAFAVNLASDAIAARKSVAIFSTEMTSEQYMIRFLSLYSGIDQRTVRDRFMLPFDSMGELTKVERTLASAPLRIYDTESQLRNIMTRAKRLKETVGLDVMIVDFIQNVSAGGDEFSDARNVALQLQNLAKNLSCTVVAFSQVSNEMAKRQADGESDNYYSFKGHGAIRDAADLGIMLRRNDRTVGLLDVIVVKNRHGETGVKIYCDMDLPTGRIDERDGYMGDDDE